MRQIDNSSVQSHTPGPWSAVPVRLGLDKAEAYDIIYGDDELILVNDVASEADALLISAAPELLEAAKAIIEVVDQGAIRSASLTFRIPLYERAAELIDAIAKAEGRSNG